MSDTTFRFELVCPEGLVLEQDVEHVIIPGSEGDFMVMPNHAPVISTLRPGILEVGRIHQDTKRYYVSNGLAEVNPTTLTILAEQALDIAELSNDFFPNQIKELESEIENSRDAAHKDTLKTRLHTLRMISENLVS